MRVQVHQIDGATTMRALPLAAGMLAASVRTDAALGPHVDVRLTTRRLPLEEAVNNLDEPDVVAFSLYTWNVRYSLALGRLIKERHPDTKVVLGGPSVPRREEAARTFLRENDFADIIAFGEGELTFREILKALHAGTNLSSVRGIAFKQHGEVALTESRERMRDLSAAASPYLEGVFDSLLAERDDLSVSALLETNRGCPFACTFCDWGQAINSRVFELPLDRVLAELKWMIDRSIPYIYIVDANFGIRPRDIKIIEAICDLKEETGLPHFVYFHLTKNAHEKNLHTVEALRNAGIGCQVALSMQDFDEDVLRAIKRDNISLPKSLGLRARCAEQHIPTFNELLLGLPGQTLASFKGSVIAALTPYVSDTFYLYPVRLLDNAEMASPEHRSRYALQTRQCRLVGHSATTDDVISELEEVVVGSSTMSTDAWRVAYTFGYVVAACHNLLLLDVVVRLLRERGVDLLGWFDAIVARMRAADSTVLGAWGHQMQRFTASILDSGPLLLSVAVAGSARREPAEALAIIALNDAARFYDEVRLVTAPWLSDDLLVEELIAFQRMVTPAPGEGPKTQTFTHDWLTFHEHRGPGPQLRRQVTTIRSCLPGWAAEADDVGTFVAGHLQTAYSKTNRVALQSDAAPAGKSAPGGVLDPHLLTRQE